MNMRVTLLCIVLAIGIAVVASSDPYENKDQEAPETRDQLLFEDRNQPLNSRRTRCPRDNSKEVYIPDRNCNKFWQCSNGVAIRMSCPKGLNWNRRLNVCDWPRRARCPGRGRYADAGELDDQDQELALSQEQIPEVEDQLLLEGELPQKDQDQPLESQRPRCPRDNSKEVYIPDRNCNKFWQCSNGAAIRMSCPKGLNWNRRLNVCDWPRRARCPGMVRSADAGELDDQDQELALSQDQIPEVEDQLLLEGELPQKDQDQPLESQRPRCPRDNSKEVYIPDRNCNKFWQCSNGVAIRMSCPKGLNWNRRLNVCDWPRRARCPGRGRSADAGELDDQAQELGLSQDQIPEVEDQLLLEGELPQKDQDQPLESRRPRCPRNSKEVYIPDRNCNKFWQCSNGVAIRMSCPKGLNWNRRLNVCDWPRRARCPGRGGSADADQLDDQDKEILLSQDYIPEVGDQLLLEGGSELPQADQDQPLESRRPRCPRDNSKEVYIPDRNCNKFWQCSNGVAIRIFCPKGLNWNCRLNVCDWPRRARCPGRGRSADADQLDHQDEELLLSQDQIPEVKDQLLLEGGSELPQEDQDQPLESRRPRCPRDNSKEVYIPDRNCNKFWQCSNGVAIRMSCPKGLNWNRKLNVCDWPRRARCPGRGRSADADQLDGQDQELLVSQDQLAEVKDQV